jgi:hypothetical protein
MSDEKSVAKNTCPAQPKRAAGELNDRVPSPVKDFDLEKRRDDRRTFSNGDTDRTDQK